MITTNRRIHIDWVQSIVDSRVTCWDASRTQWQVWWSILSEEQQSERNRLECAVVSAGRVHRFDSIHCPKLILMRCDGAQFSCFDARCCHSVISEQIRSKCAQIELLLMEADVPPIKANWIELQKAEVEARIVKSSMFKCFHCGNEELVVELQSAEYAGGAALENAHIWQTFFSNATEPLWKEKIGIAKNIYTKCQAVAWHTANQKNWKLDQKMMLQKWIASVVRLHWITRVPLHSHSWPNTPFSRRTTNLSTLFDALLVAMMFSIVIGSKHCTNEENGYVCKDAASSEIHWFDITYTMLQAMKTSKAHTATGHGHYFWVGWLSLITNKVLGYCVIIGLIFLLEARKWEPQEETEK